jgi:hypothetical protein
MLSSTALHFFLVVSTSEVKKRQKSNLADSNITVPPLCVSKGKRNVSLFLFLTRRKCTGSAAQPISTNFSTIIQCDGLQKSFIRVLAKYLLYTTKVIQFAKPFRGFPFKKKKSSLLSTYNRIMKSYLSEKKVKKR